MTVVATRYYDFVITDGHDDAVDGTKVVVSVIVGDGGDPGTGTPFGVGGAAVATTKPCEAESPAGTLPKL